MNTARIVTWIAAASIAGAAAVVSPRGEGTAPYVPTDAERARWTMADMRTLGTALEAFRVDNGKYPEAASFEELVTAIEPIYVRAAPLHDAWGTRFKYVPDPDRSGYLIVSAGSDARFDESGWPGKGEAEDYSVDAVLRDGALTRPWACR